MRTGTYFKFSVQTPLFNPLQPPNLNPYHSHRNVPVHEAVPRARLSTDRLVPRMQTFHGPRGPRESFLPSCQEVYGYRVYKLSLSASSIGPRHQLELLIKRSQISSIRWSGQHSGRKVTPLDWLLSLSLSSPPISPLCH